MVRRRQEGEGACIFEPMSSKYLYLAPTMRIRVHICANLRKEISTLPNHSVQEECMNKDVLYTINEVSMYVNSTRRFRRQSVPEELCSRMAFVSNQYQLQSRASRQLQMPMHFPTHGSLRNLVPAHWATAIAGKGYQ